MATPRNGLLDRDRTCVELLRGLTEVMADGGVVIGGYAVTAWGSTRFSVDLDLVIHKEHAEGCRRILKERGLTRMKPWDGGGVFAGESERWQLGESKFSPAVDLLIGGLHDRNTGVSFSFAEIRQRSLIKGVGGASSTLTVSAWIPSREALIGMKLLPFRKTDTWDIFALCSPALMVREIVDFLGNWSKTEIAKRMKEFLRRIAEPGFRGSVKQIFAATDDKAYDRQTNSARSFARELIVAAQ